MIDETGKRYGRLVVVSRAPNYETNNKTLAQWNCRCDDDNECIVLGADLRSGHVQSCGCLKKERAQQNCRKAAQERKGTPAENLVNEIGNVYGSLTVIESLPSRNRKAYWLCRCDCGRTKESSGDSLRSGKVTSCDCLYRNIDKFTKRKPRYVDYKRNAARRGYEFSLSKEEFDRITDLPCTYCDEDGPNGVDRKNNDLGYIIENTVPSCTICNRMKLTLTHDQFLTRCRKIVNKYIFTSSINAGTIEVA